MLDVRNAFRGKNLVRLDKSQRVNAGWRGSFYIFGHNTLPIVVIGINLTGRYALVYKSDLNHAESLCKEGRAQRRAHKQPPLKPTEAYFFVFQGQEDNRQILGNTLSLEMLQLRIKACKNPRVADTPAGPAYQFDDGWQIIEGAPSGDLPFDFAPSAKPRGEIQF